MPYAAYPATSVLREPAQSIRSICSEIYTENAAGFRYHLDWTPGLNTCGESRRIEYYNIDDDYDDEDDNANDDVEDDDVADHDVDDNDVDDDEVLKMMMLRMLLRRVRKRMTMRKRKRRMQRWRMMMLGRMMMRMVMGDDDEDGDGDVDHDDDDDDDDDADDDVEDDDVEDAEVQEDNVENDDVQEDEDEDDDFDEDDEEDDNSMRKMKWRRTSWMMMIYDDVEKNGEHDVEDGDVLEDDEKDNNVAEDEVEEDDVAEDEVEDDGAEDDDVKGGKLMIVKMMMLRRRTDPKTEDHTLCETARSKCTWTYCLRATSNRNPQDKFCGPDWAQNADTHFVRACAAEIHVRMSQETSDKSHFRRKFRGKNPRPRLGPESGHTHTLDKNGSLYDPKHAD